MIDRNNIVPAPDAYRKRLGEMLDLTYELEGLLHIGVTRSSVPPRLNQLIVDKLNAIVALADEPARPEELAEAPEYELESAEEPDTRRQTADADQADADPADEGTADEGAAEEGEDNEGAADAPQARPYIDEEPAAADAGEMPADGGSDDGGAADAPQARPYIVPTEPEQPKAKPGRLFSVNDRFLYARELFGNNLRNFDKAIDETITLDNYDEAEEYFVSEWDIDPESPTGMRFLATIMKMF